MVLVECTGGGGGISRSNCANRSVTSRYLFVSGLDTTINCTREHSVYFGNDKIALVYFFSSGVPI